MVRGPTFIRLLARLTDVGAPPSSQSLSDRLAQWLDWTHAIALSTALDGKPSESVPETAASDAGEEGECARVRAVLERAIAGAPELAVARRSAAARSLVEEGANVEIDFAEFRQCYLAFQRKMLAATGNLRGRLREALAAKTPGTARLAALDAAMELALSAREQKLLAAVPALLGEHFERLRRAESKAQADAGEAEAAPAPPHGAWLEVFRRDMQSVLLAELDVRFQPVEALLAALRTN